MEDCSVDSRLLRLDPEGWDGTGEARLLRFIEGGEEGERRGLGDRGVGSVAFSPVISLCALDGERP